MYYLYRTFVETFKITSYVCDTIISIDTNIIFLGELKRQRQKLLWWTQIRMKFNFLVISRLTHVGPALFLFLCLGSKYTKKIRNYLVHVINLAYLAGYLKPKHKQTQWDTDKRKTRYTKIIYQLNLKFAIVLLAIIYCSKHDLYIGLQNHSNSRSNINGLKEV